MDSILKFDRLLRILERRLQESREWLKKSRELLKENRERLEENSERFKKECFEQGFEHFERTEKIIERSESRERLKEKYLFTSESIHEPLEQLQLERALEQSFEGYDHLHKSFSVSRELIRGLHKKGI